MAQLSWAAATTVAALDAPQIKRLGLGVKGVVSFSAIYTGGINAEEPANPIETRHGSTDREELYPYFLPATG